MPDSSLNPSLDGYQRRISSTSWSDAKGSATTNATSYSYTTTTSNLGVYARATSGRGVTTYYCYRSYFQFDVSGESGTVDSAVIKLYIDHLGSPDTASRYCVLKGASTLSGNASDHGNVYSSGTTYYANYSDVVTVSITAGIHTFTLNSDGILRLNSAIGSGTFTVGLVAASYDGGIVTPSAGGNYTRTDVNYVESTNSAKRPILEIDYEAVVARNAILFGTNF